ncbi:type II toxin-antitoxin system PrlF family antitoxin [Paenibacillus alginolyticus]|uniref:AbrB/MazE/SpoVT family DNA-binding domain-containing protein n=1 Tax=Paenibacillus alginolyticus TaxID=59839 RepID=UPI00042224F2|nr:type II toxin-antitoxin system PrlF family antitoxin [Paenibacillus alginolyticus]MCY9665738.1 type II toxin-antitoxin system PrlF family antitoxin [Paenibacillus alginolyticus]
MFYSKITSKGQTTVPMEIRKRLGLQEGSIIKYSFNENGEVVLKKDTLTTLMENGLRFFYFNASGRCFEIFRDKTRSEVDQEWLNDQRMHNRERNFKSMVIHEAQLGYLRDSMLQETFIPIVNPEAINLYHSLGLLTDEEFDLFQERKRIRDQR